MIVAHEVPPGTDRCKWCGALRPDPEKSTCIPRHGVVEQAPDRPRRIDAVYDIDTINSRLAELELARKEALNTVDGGT